MAKAKRKAKKPAPVRLSGAFGIGQRVQIVAGDFGNSRGIVESIAAQGITVRIHGRLAVTVPAENLRAL